MPGGRGPGFIYILDLNKGNCYKIGQTTNTFKRLKAMQSSNPWAKYIVYELVYNASHVEKKLHSLFKKQKLQREIFILTEDNIEEAKKIMKEYIFS